MGKDRPRDTNALAARIVAEATVQVERTEPPSLPDDDAEPDDR